MLSIGYVLVAIVDFALLVWAVGQCRKYPVTAMYLVTVPLTLLWFDNLVIALGGTIGEGDLLKALNTPRFLGHYILLPMTIIGIGSMGRLGGFPWAQPKIVMAAFCLLATWFIGHDLWLFAQSTFYPSCFADTLRYTTHISEATACGPDAQIGVGAVIPPIPAITLSNLLLVFGIYLWVKIGWKWLAIGTFVALGFFAAPYSLSGGFLGNVGEPIITYAVVATAAHLAKLNYKPAA